MLPLGSVAGAVIPLKRPHNMPTTGDIPVESIVDLLSTHVRTPSRAGEDDLSAICAVARDWFERENLRVIGGFRVLRSEQGMSAAGRMPEFGAMNSSHSPSPSASGPVPTSATSAVPRTPVAGAGAVRWTE